MPRLTEIAMSSSRITRGRPDDEATWRSRVYRLHQTFDPAASDLRCNPREVAKEVARATMCDAGMRFGDTMAYTPRSTSV